MRILVVHRYFWPDVPPYASTLRTIAARLQREGHEVTVLSTQPSYGTNPPSRQPRWERLDGLSVIRLGVLPERSRLGMARGINAMLFALRAALHLLRRTDYDVVMSATSPPVVLSAVMSVAARACGASFVYHNQDIYPELALRSGLLDDGLIARLLRRIDLGSARRATAVVVLSDDMRRTHLERGVPADRIHIINNFDLEERVETGPVPDALSKPDGSFRVVYAGNVGRFQGLPAVVDAARLLADQPRVRFDFLGDGVAIDELRRQAGDLLGRTVFFHGRHPHETAMRVVESSDLALISLGPGLIGCAYPGKTMGYLAAGVPLLVVAEATSELARMVVEERVGVTAPPGDSAALAEAVRDVVRREAELPVMRLRAREVLDERFAREIALAKWVSLFEGIDAARCAKITARS